MKKRPPRRIGSEKQILLSKRSYRAWDRAKRLENRRIDRGRVKSQRKKL